MTLFNGETDASYSAHLDFLAERDGCIVESLIEVNENSEDFILQHARHVVPDSGDIQKVTQHHHTTSHLQQ